MTVHITYWGSENGHSKPISRIYTNVLRVYTRYSTVSDNDYLAVQTDSTTKYIIREDISKLDIRG